jgi:hypothetical protein
MFEKGMKHTCNQQMLTVMRDITIFQVGFFRVSTFFIIYYSVFFLDFMLMLSSFEEKHEKKFYLDGMDGFVENLHNILIKLIQ